MMTQLAQVRSAASRAIAREPTTVLMHRETGVGSRGWPPSSATNLEPPAQKPSSCV
jgi:hypothetical protein